MTRRSPCRRSRRAGQFGGSGRGGCRAGPERPCGSAGGRGWTEAACAELRAFAEAHDLPVGTAFRRQDLLDNRSASYAGDIGLSIDPALAKRIEDADLLLVIGAQLGEIVTDGKSTLGKLQDDSGKLSK